jgi:anti-sigma B factor antagonist
MLRLRCVKCGLTVPYKGSGADHCPRCQLREGQAVGMIPVSDRPSTTATAGRLVVRTKSHGDVRTIFLSGEVDLASAQMLRETLAESCTSGAQEIVLDLSGVEFMDSTGLSAILEGKTFCEEHGCSYSLTPAQRPVEHVLERIGVREMLRLRSAKGQPARRQP